MRTLLYSTSAIAIIGLAYWAYNENYETQEALRRVDALQKQIGQTREELGVLKAEWAYLNRPDRLRELADLNFGTLQLMPLAPEHFGEATAIIFPKIILDHVTEPVDVSAEDDALTPEVTE